MKGKQTWTLPLVAVLTLGAGEVAGQSERRERGPRVGMDAEIVMSMRDRLELDDERAIQLGQKRDPAQVLEAVPKALL